MVLPLIQPLMRRPLYAWPQHPQHSVSGQGMLTAIVFAIAVEEDHENCVERYWRRCPQRNFAACPGGLPYFRSTQTRGTRRCFSWAHKDFYASLSAALIALRSPSDCEEMRRSSRLKFELAKWPNETDSTCFRSFHSQVPGIGRVLCGVNERQHHLAPNKAADASSAGGQC